MYIIKAINLFFLYYLNKIVKKQIFAIYFDFKYIIISFLFFSKFKIYVACLYLINNLILYLNFLNFYLLKAQSIFKKKIKR